MKRFFRLALTLTIAIAAARGYTPLFAQLQRDGLEQRSTLTIRPDGSCIFDSVSVESRSVMEKQVRMMERFEKMAETMGEGTDEPRLETTESNAQPKPFSDEELTRKVRDLMENRFGQNEDRADQEVKTELTKDTVTIRTTRSFASLEDLLKNGANLWWQAGFAAENVRFEQVSNSLIRVTLTPSSEMKRYFKSLRAQWKLSGTKSEFKMVFPGKVVASGFPESKTNATWLAIDPKNDGSLDAAMKLYDVPAVITAEAGGLKISQPLELKELQRSVRRGGDAGDDLPIADAGPGFMAEAQSITVTTLKLFPGGEAYFKESGRMDQQKPGAIVSTKLFVPKGRILQSVSGVRVAKAVDDKGRAIAPSPEDDEISMDHSYSEDSRDAQSADLELRLQLPQADAQAIDEIAAEAVVVTAGAWKKMTLTNIQENATNEFDLAAVLPGAKLVITKYTRKNRQLNIQAQLKGPRTIKRLDLQVKVPDRERLSTSSAERKFSMKGNEATRTLSIQGYGFDGGPGAGPGDLVLVVRFPEDLKRERVNFKLKGLDLL